MVTRSAKLLMVWLAAMVVRRGYGVWKEGLSGFVGERRGLKERLVGEVMGF